jgi:Fur family ferric uptake transcriptional regulator
MTIESRTLERLRDLGLRITEPRRELIQAIYQTQGPFTAEDLHDHLRVGGSRVGRATVFRTLDLLAGLRVLERVHQPDGHHSYVLSGPGHRHHLVCLACGNVVEFQGCNVDNFVGQLSSQTDFKIEGHWLEVFGRCATCQG